MKKYLFIIAPLLFGFGCQKYTKYYANQDSPIAGKWTFQKDTVTVYYGTTINRQLINNIGAGTTLQFTGDTQFGTENIVANPDTLLQFIYAASTTSLSIQYPVQLVYGVQRAPLTINYTIVQCTDHLLKLHYETSFIDPLGTEGQTFANYYWTK